MRAEIAAEAVDAAFEELGSPANYTPPGGPASSCLVMRTRPDAIMSPAMTPIVEASDAIDVRAKEVAQPVEGGTFQLLDDEGAVTATLIVAARPVTADAERLIWRCPVR